MSQFESILRTVVNTVKCISDFFNRKSIKRYVFFLFAVFLMMNSFQSYAQGSDGEGGLQDTEDAMSAVDVGMYNNRSVKLDLDTQQAWVDSSEKIAAIEGTEDPNSSTTINNTIQSTLNWSVCSFASPDMCLSDEEMQQLWENPRVSAAATVGALEFTSSHAVGFAYNQPNTSVTQHLAREWVPGYSKSNAGVYAGGYDYLSGSGVMSLWKVTLTMAYVMFVVVLMVAGFMIMFRRKLGGQMVVTVYNTLPNIVVGLLLVTFSFAIVGMVLNVSAYATNLSRSILYADMTIGEDEAMYMDSPISLATFNIDKLVEVQQEAAADWMSEQAKKIPGDAAQEVVIALTSLMTGDNLIAEQIRDGVELIITTSPITMVASLIILLVYAFASVKVYIALLKAYGGILVDTVLGPIVLALASVPGQGKLRTAWFNRLLRNALTFPVVFIMINLPLYLRFSSADFNLNFYGLSRGTLTTSGAFLQGATTSAIWTGIIGLLVKGLVPLFLYFTAAQVPEMLKGVFPTEENKGFATAAQGVKQSVSKIPIVGGFFKG